MNTALRRIWRIVPLAVCLAVGFLWWLSRHQPRVLLVRGVGGHALVLASEGGGLYFFDGTAHFEGVVDVSGELRSVAGISMTAAEFQDGVAALLDQSSSHVARAHFCLAIGPKAGASAPGLSRFFLLAVPDWLVLLAAAPGVLGPLWRWVIRWRRRSKGLCPACGYDLRMSPGRCPECGAGAGANAVTAVLGAGTK